jgi:hypothetical protein
MARLTFKKWFEHYKPDEETTTILANGYTQIVEADEMLPNNSKYFLVGSAIEKLAEYEDAEEQGLLLRLPCKVGDTVYQIIRVFNNFGKHYSIIKTEFRLVDLDLFELGYIFLTKEEAEQKLTEMGGEA